MVFIARYTTHLVARNPRLHKLKEVSFVFRYSNSEIECSGIQYRFLPLANIELSKTIS